MEATATMRRVVTALLLVAGGMVSGVEAARPVAYTGYQFGAAGPFQSFEMYFRWELIPAPPASIYPAFTFGLEEGGGYMGPLLGTSGDALSKQILFAIWDTQTDSGSAVPVGPTCDRFGGEGTGAHCAIPFDWQEGHEYRLRLAPVGLTPTGEQWEVTVHDPVLATDTSVGTIELRDSGSHRGYGRLTGYTTTFLEYFGGPDTCTGQPYARVRWRGPYADAETVEATQANAPDFSDCAVNVSSTGRPLVTHEGGGTVEFLATPQADLWLDPCTDSEGDGVCDAEEHPLALSSLRLTAGPGPGLGSIQARGQTGRPTGGFTVQVWDPAGLYTSFTFGAGDCVPAGGRLRCTRTAGRMRWQARFQEMRRTPGLFAMTLRFSRLDLSGPLVSPVTVRVTDATGANAVGQMASCRPTPAGLRCP